MAYPNSERLKEGSMSTPSRKPTGTLGAVTFGSEGRMPAFNAVQFPPIKEEIETFVLNAALRQMRKNGQQCYDLIAEPVQNPQNSFDFTLLTSSGEQYLDLMEVAPLEHIQGSYDNAPHSYNHGGFADAVWGKVDAKSKKYGSSPRAVIHLLLYSTDWRFRIAEEVITLLAYWCICRTHCFKTIVYYIPHNQIQEEIQGELKLIYPRLPEEFTNFDEMQYRQRQSAWSDLTQDPRIERSLTGSSISVSCVEFSVPEREEPAKKQEARGKDIIYRSRMVY